MSASRIIGICLLIAGCLSLGYGGITYTKRTHPVTIGTVEISVKKKETLNIPIWAGITCVFIGGILVVGRGKDD